MFWIESFEEITMTALRLLTASEISKAILGKTLEEASKIAEANRFNIRVAALERKNMIGDCAINMSRLNVSIEGGLISNVDIG